MPFQIPKRWVGGLGVAGAAGLGLVFILTTPQEQIGICGHSVGHEGHVIDTKEYPNGRREIGVNRMRDGAHTTGYDNQGTGTWPHIMLSCTMKYLDSDRLQLYWNIAQTEGYAYGSCPEL